MTVTNSELEKSRFGQGMRQRILLYSVTTMALIAFTVGSVFLYVLYQAAYTQEQENLTSLVSSQVELIQAVARFGKVYSTSAIDGGAEAATISQVVDAISQAEGIGDTGEFLFGVVDDGFIIFPSKLRYVDNTSLRISYENSQLSAPMRLALAGSSGTVVGLDYRGQTVLGAYLPIPELNAGFVAKMDIAEIRAPFIRAGIVSSIIASVLTLAGSLLMVMLNSPLIRRVEDSQRQLREANLQLESDIQERKETEQALELAKQAAEAGTQAKSAFLANMSHEIRTPMNAVLGYTQILQRLPNLSNDQTHMLDAIRSSGDHLLSIINDILELSRVEAGYVVFESSTFSLQKLLSDLDIMFRLKTNSANVKLIFETKDETLNYLVGDLNRIRQVLINLVGNAVKFTEHGRIIIKVSRISSPNKQIEEENTLYLLFEVDDTGRGIPQEALNTIFGNFEQVDTKSGENAGTGLGLAISRKFARLMGGDITLSSVYGKGSCFSFVTKLKIGKKEYEDQLALPKVVEKIKETSKKWRVLVIDDVSANRDLLYRMLSSLGFIIQETSSAEKGLELYYAWKPEIILLDLVMPKVSGREVLREIRNESTADKPCIIILTASILSDEKDNVLALGANAFLSKPFLQEELCEEIRKHTDVEYIYSNEEDIVEVSTSSQVELTLQSAIEIISTLPEGLSSQLRSIVERGAINEAIEIVPVLTSYNEELSKFFQEYTDSYQLDELRALWI